MARDKEQVTSDERKASIKTILLVEDDANIGEVLVQAITQETPYLPVLAADGFEALNVVRGVRPNLLILDYQMPRMNGIELYDQLHAIKALEQVPAIMMSARLPQQDLHKRKILGMNKPIDLDEFLRTIEELLT
ncbi:MAG TPA: response regulator [Ktedonosporobacter sp.]|nr:response regulator [Ktedonosporobacter sp.]